jgi:hypothetical protein
MRRFIPAMLCWSLLPLSAQPRTYEVSPRIGGTQATSSGGTDLENRATLSGVVKSSDGKPVEGADVTSYDTVTEQTKKTKTDKRGRYSFISLHSGTYWVQAKLGAPADATTNPSSGEPQPGAASAETSASSTTVLQRSKVAEISLGSHAKIALDLVVSPVKSDQ